LQPPFSDAVSAEWKIRAIIASGLKCLFLALSGVLLLRIDMSGIGAGADMQRCLALIACAAYDPSLHLAANFAVTHNAALW
jgi:hypothetical protein